MKKWSTESVDNVKVLPDKAVNEILKVLKHVQAGCLSGIPPGIKPAQDSSKMVEEGPYRYSLSCGYAF